MTLNWQPLLFILAANAIVLPLLCWRARQLDADAIVLAAAILVTSFVIGVL